MKKLFISALFLFLTSFAYSKERMIIQAVAGKSYTAYISRTDSAYIDINLPKGNNGYDASYFLLLIKEYENKGWKVINIAPQVSNGWIYYFYTLEK